MKLQVERNGLVREKDTFWERIHSPVLCNWRTHCQRSKLWELNLEMYVGARSQSYLKNLDFIVKTSGFLRKILRRVFIFGSNLKDEI